MVDEGEVENEVIEIEAKPKVKKLRIVKPKIKNQQIDVIPATIDWSFYKKPRRARWHRRGLWKFIAQA